MQRKDMGKERTKDARRTVDVYVLNGFKRYDPSHT